MHTFVKRQKWMKQMGFLLIWSYIKWGGSVCMTQSRWRYNMWRKGTDYVTWGGLYSKWSGDLGSLHVAQGTKPELECARWMCQKRDQIPKPKNNKEKTPKGPPHPLLGHRKPRMTNEQGLGAGITIWSGAKGRLWWGRQWSGKSQISLVVV